jgi:serine/threonine protein kinase
MIAPVYPSAGEQTRPNVMYEFVTPFAPLFRSPQFDREADQRGGMGEAIDRLTAALADRYRIEKEIGSGGMATVYRAEDLRHDRKVAVKVLRRELAAAIGPER